MRSLKLVLWILAGMLVSMSPAAGQEEPDTAARSAVLREAVDSHWRVRVSTPRDTAKGRALRLVADSLRLVGARVPVDQISRIERGERHGGGALHGALVGGAALGALGYFFSGLCDANCAGVTIKTTAGGAFVGGIIGGFLGHVLDPPDDVWTVLWP